MPGKCKFQDEWIYHGEYRQWIARTPSKCMARCRLCMKDLDVSNMGEAALKSHMASVKHISRLRDLTAAQSCTGLKSMLALQQKNEKASQKTEKQ